MNSAPVLILSQDALIAALLGAFVETIDLRPAFATPGETPRDALVRVRPRLVLLDCDYPDGCSDSFLGPATMMKTAVILFGSRRDNVELRALAAELRLPYMELPIPPARFAELVREAISGRRQ